MDEIDQFNILNATMIAMTRAVNGLGKVPDMALIDGNRCPELSCRSKSIVGGDALHPEISAASILAKQYRDNLMRNLSSQFPGFGFEKHKGYPTRSHIEAMQKLGYNTTSSPQFCTCQKYNRTMNGAFTHLHLHSEYSLADGIVRIKPLVKRLADLKMSAVALTDSSNFYAVVKFYRACLAEGIKPIIGCDVWIESPDTPDQHHRYFLLCQDNTGYKNLSKLLTDAYLRGHKKGMIVLCWSDFVDLNEGLIVILDAQEGALSTLMNSTK